MPNTFFCSGITEKEEKTAQKKTRLEKSRLRKEAVLAVEGPFVLRVLHVLWKSETTCTSTRTQKGRFEFVTGCLMVLNAKFDPPLFRRAHANPTPTGRSVSSRRGLVSCLRARLLSSRSGRLLAQPPRTVRPCFISLPAAGHVAFALLIMAPWLGRASGKVSRGANAIETTSGSVFPVCATRHSMQLQLVRRGLAVWRCCCLSVLVRRR